jgi:hypothetical protein
MFVFVLMMYIITSADGKLIAHGKMFLVTLNKHSLFSERRRRLNVER